MSRLLTALLLGGALAIAGCASPTATPQPTATPMPTATATVIPTRTPIPTATPAPVPSEPDAFAAYILSNYGSFNGQDLGLTGEHIWLEGSENHLILSLSKGMFGEPYSGLEVIRDQDAVEQWIAPVVRDMDAFAGGATWRLWYSFRRVETDAAKVGADSVTWKEWSYTDTSYDSEAGGFHVTDYPIRIGKSDDNVVHYQFMPMSSERGFGYFTGLLRRR